MTALGTLTGAWCRRLLAALAVWCLCAAAAAETLVAAASDLKFALDEVIGAFHADTGQAVKVSYGSSGVLTQQIGSGAPFDLLLSADESYVTWLQERGLTRDAGRLYAEGRLVLYAASGSPVAVDQGFAGLSAALTGGHLRHLAIANPEHAPYGRAAAEALRQQGLWDAVQPTLVLGENVSQAAQFAASGAAQAGLVAYSLVRSPALADRGRYWLVPSAWHQPLRQRMVLMRTADATAEALYAYLGEDRAREILARYGFALP